MIDLVGITTFVNLLALAASLWLGFYIITRSSQSDLSRLAALALWLLSAFFLYNTLAINLPGTGVLAWLRQTIILVMPVWLHVTVQLQPSRTSWSPRILLGLTFAYILAIVLFFVGVIGSGLVSDASTQPAVYTSGRAAGPLFILFFAFLAIVLTVSLANLIYLQRRAADAVLRKQATALVLATALAGAGGVYTSAGIQLRLDWPTLPGDILLAAGVLLLGYAVARYSALLEGWRIQRDFIYTLISLGTLTAFYVFAVYLFYAGGQISFLTLILTIVGTIAFNSLYDGIRVALDRLFYHHRYQQLRSNLRMLAREVGTGRTMTEQLDAIVASLCAALGIRKGIIALKNADRFEVVASHNTELRGKTFPLGIFATVEIVGLHRVSDQDLQDLGLLIPLYVENTQVGALVLGYKARQHPYSEQDLELLEDLADQIAGVIRVQQIQEENTNTMNTLLADFRQRERSLELQIQQMVEAPRPAQRVEVSPIAQGMDEEELAKAVEDALRHFSDYAYLGDHPLAKFRTIDRLLQKNSGAVTTSLDRGKKLNEVLLHALDKLRPSGTEPKTDQVPSREWWYFILLTDSYVRDCPTRDIMGRLCIGEGTFNRTRKRAIRAVAKALMEEEQTMRDESSQQSTVNSRQ